MWNDLPSDASTLMSWTWTNFEPYYQDLLQRPLRAETVNAWLEDWSALDERLMELRSRLHVATAVNTADEVARQRLEAFFDQIFPQAMAAEQKLKQKLLASGLEPAGFEIPLRNMRAEVALFREENLPLLAEEQKLIQEYDRIVGAQTVEWDGQERTPQQMRTVLQDPDRARREEAWRRVAQRQLADRAALNDLWVRLFRLRRQIAHNAGFASYRDYRWQQLLRFDYTPADCERFREAIAAVVVPQAAARYERRRRLMGLTTLRPWDLEADPLGRPPLRPFRQAGELAERAAHIFAQVDATLGRYFETMRRENLLDLENRKNKAPGGFCTEFAVQRRPFIFMNAVGIHDDVSTLVHEGGHAFHVFETAPIRLVHLLEIPMEFAEVASMSMEYLTLPYLEAAQGGFYPAEDADRARVEQMEGALLFWPFMAVVDGFQHWAYTHPDEAVDPARCDAAWGALWERFMVGVDWSGLDEEMKTGWQRKLHIYEVPFYYIEYGLAQLGALQVWRNAQRDPHEAVTAYRRALALGGSRPLPDLYRTAGARFSFEAALFREVTDAMQAALHTWENDHQGG